MCFTSLFLTGKKKKLADLYKGRKKNGDVPVLKVKGPSIQSGWSVVGRTAFHISAHTQTRRKQYPAGSVRMYE